MQELGTFVLQAKCEPTMNALNTMLMNLLAFILFFNNVLIPCRTAVAILSQVSK